MRYPIKLYEVATAEDKTLWWYAGFRMRNHHGKCGHRHRTQEAAEKCIPFMEGVYKLLRWPKNKVAR